MFSKACEYGLQAVLYIALQEKEGRKVGLKEISESQEVPHHFLSKILQKLVRNEVLDSIKGPSGGFSLKISASELRLLEIVEIIDGLDIINRCCIGLKTCSDASPCPVHHDYKIVKEKIHKLLQEKTLEELCADVQHGNAIVNFTNTKKRDA